MARTLTVSKQSSPRRDLGDELAFIRSEQRRIQTERRIDRDLPQHVEDDLAPRERLSREAYEAIFDPNGLYLY